MIYIGADHRGFNLKEMIKKRLLDHGVKVLDLGNDHLDATDDYVDFAHKVADFVAADKGSYGIVICGSGNGMAMAANKVGGIRCALAFDEDRAKQSREDEDANILAIPADAVTDEKGWQIAKSFLTTRFPGEERHVRRIQKIIAIEKKHD